MSIRVYEWGVAGEVFPTLEETVFPKDGVLWTLKKSNWRRFADLPCCWYSAWSRPLIRSNHIIFVDQPAMLKTCTMIRCQELLIGAWNFPMPLGRSTLVNRARRDQVTTTSLSRYDTVDYCTKVTVNSTQDCSILSLWDWTGHLAWCNRLAHINCFHL